MTDTCSMKFDGKTTELIDKLKVSSRSESRSETLRKALYLLSLVCDTKEKGGKIFITNDKTDTRKEIILY